MSSDELDVAMTYGDLRDLAENAGLTNDAPVFVETSWAADTRRPVEAGSSSDGQLRLWIDLAFDRAAALRDVEALLRRVQAYAVDGRGERRFHLADGEAASAAVLAALIVDRVLGGEPSE